MRIALFPVALCLVPSTVSLRPLPSPPASLRPLSASPRPLTRSPPTAAASLSSPATTDKLSTTESSALLAALQKRVDEIGEGAGKRYRVNSVRGFLNVHEEPGDPWRTDNVCAQLDHGAVVQSLEEDGAWVCHDAGGWSGPSMDQLLLPTDFRDCSNLPLL